VRREKKKEKEKEKIVRGKHGTASKSLLSVHHQQAVHQVAVLPWRAGREDPHL
jgi:hypothetical protein